MIRAYLLLGATALFGNGAVLSPAMERYHRLAEPAAAVPAIPSTATASATAIRSADGLFRLSAAVERRPVTFVVDTGATVTVLSRRDAARIGLAAGRGDRSGSLVTANGSAPVTWKRVGALTVAGTRIPELDVVVGGDGVAQSLLGQDVLSRIGAITISGDQLEVRPTGP